MGGNAAFNYVCVVKAWYDTFGRRPTRDVDGTESLNVTKSGTANGAESSVDREKLTGQWD